MQTKNIDNTRNTHVHNENIFLFVVHIQLFKHHIWRHYSYWATYPAGYCMLKPSGQLGVGQHIPDAGGSNEHWVGKSQFTHLDEKQVLYIYIVMFTHGRIISDSLVHTTW